MVRINLLPIRAIKKKEAIRQTLSVGILSLVLYLLLVSFLQISISKKVSSLEKEIAQLREANERLKAAVGEVIKLKEKTSLLNERLQVIAALEAGRDSPLRLLEGLSKNIPEKVWLNSFNKKGSQIELGGIALDNQTLAGFLEKLKLSPYFKGVELIIVKKASGSDLNLKEAGDLSHLNLRSFVINCIEGKK